MKLTDEQDNRLHRAAQAYRYTKFQEREAWADIVRTVEALMTEARAARAAEYCGQLDLGEGDDA